MGGVAGGGDASRVVVVAVLLLILLLLLASSLAAALLLLKSTSKFPFSNTFAGLAGIDADLSLRLGAFFLVVSVADRLGATGATGDPKLITGGDEPAPEASSLTSSWSNFGVEISFLSHLCFKLVYSIRPMKVKNRIRKNIPSTTNCQVRNNPSCEEWVWWGVGVEGLGRGRGVN